jgi:cysteine desulfurase
VDVTGVVDVPALAERLAGTDPGRRTADGVDVVAVQAANHEVGTVQPVGEIIGLAAEQDVPVVVDASQTLAWGPPPDGWSVLAGSAHKWGGPAGVGVLAVRRRTRFRSVLPEDERGSGLVPGFENVPGALAAAAALRARREEAAALEKRLRPLVERIRARVPVLVDDVQVVGHPTQRLPHLVTFSCLYVDGEALLTALDAEGFAVSSGSSCTASTLRPSHVLEAMGVLTHGNVRVSLSRDTTARDVERFLDVLPRVVAGVRAQLGADRL